MLQQVLGYVCDVFGGALDPIFAHLEMNILQEDSVKK